MRTPTYAELQTLVRECLWQDWDPIGVNHYESASDEYDSYAPTIAAMLLDGADTYRLRQHLRRLETETMGLSPFHPTTDAAVSKLLELVGK